MMNLLNAYTATTAAMAYILGFLMGDKVYLIRLTDLPAWIIKEDRAATSHGGGKKLRVRMNAVSKRRLMDLGAHYIGTTAEVLASRKNCGEAFEKWVTESAGQTWVKDSVPYWVDGDLTENGVKYQIKFDGATLATEKAIMKALATV